MSHDIDLVVLGEYTEDDENETNYPIGNSWQSFFEERMKDPKYKAAYEVRQAKDAALAKLPVRALWKESIGAVTGPVGRDTKAWYTNRQVWLNRRQYAQALRLDRAYRRKQRKLAKKK